MSSRTLRSLAEDLRFDSMPAKFRWSLEWAADQIEAKSSTSSLRDTFAAAALTGLLSNVQRYQNGPLTQQAFEIADFMLRERERSLRKE